MNDLTSKYVGINSQYNPNLRFLENEMKNYYILCMPGGTRSGKTYSAVQWMWRQMEKYKGIEYSIVRETLPAVKETVIKDFVQVGMSAGLYTDQNHNLTEKKYFHKGNTVDYFSGDDEGKVRGRKRHILYLNEGPELKWEVVQQLMLRTPGKIIIDYNPSYPESWVYENILTRKDCAFIKTTYRDNPHLSLAQIENIEWMRLNDPEGYKVFGLGERGELKGAIYSNWRQLTKWEIHGSVICVIDFGFTNDPTCIAEFQRHNRSIYGRELHYDTAMTNQHIAFVLAFNGYDNNKRIIADSAEPKSITELQNGYRDISYETFDKIAFELKKEIPAGLRDDMIGKMKGGFLVYPAMKGPDSVLAGINKLKEHELFITSDSVNAWKEYRLYKWKENPSTGKLTNTPVDKDNHFMDCARMFALNYEYHI